MKAPALLLIPLVAVALTAAAQTGPKSPLYLTNVNSGPKIVVVQGNSVINTFPEAYGSPTEGPIAVWGDVRTAGYVPGAQGGQYTLGGTPTGTFYAMPSTVRPGFDSTSDGSHNYLVDWDFGTVYQTARDYTNPTALFGTGRGYELGITYDASNQSLWIANWLNNTVSDYSLRGGLLSSFSTGHIYNDALALDPADDTLWLVNGGTGNLEQYSTAGALLSVGPYIGTALGGEFNLAPTTPEPGTLIMFGSGILGLAGV